MMSGGARRVKVRRVPLLVVGMLSLLVGMWLGLARLGWMASLPWDVQFNGHGPLMIGGFLGTLITLERAVAFGAGWSYAAPVLVAAGAIWLLSGAASAWSAALITGGSIVMFAVSALLWKRHASLFLAAMTIGAAAWVIGNVAWLGGGAVFQVVPWWIAFLVLTIAAERLELNRVLRPTLAVRLAFVAAMAIVIAGAAASAAWLAGGTRVFGGGLILVALWLARYDVARRTVRQRGLTRFMAVSLLTGYAWLAAGGAVAMVTGAAVSGVHYDAMLHAILLGFVMSMVFAHAPIIFPAVTGIAIPYRPAFYVHLLLLHGSLAVRLAGDLVDPFAAWRAWGGLLNAAALLLFIANTAGSVAASRIVPKKEGRLKPAPTE